ncbi:ABC transporter substrate-binding protein [Nonomuraea soli]|uniref:Putative spermidine/putrescine transport system substrate-binding protein n=1 Tax=Nonomuraea soli TaxID=1032476 RepID=A0A7W0CR49_9ACTN|nr:ABC transporter substrate-binding protein [Nonomuraea soli]MBA2895786.1 putative spermidine/putrescine transport system substrate-binding protein [Nonomuraea soli]
MTESSKAVLMCAAAFLLAGCGQTAVPEQPLPPVNVQAASLKEGFTTLDRLAETARKEGGLNLIGLPRSWVNYGEIIDAFSEKYGIKVNELEPDASSARQLASTAKPDCFELSLDTAVANAARFAPYKVAGWQDLPDEVKQPDGAWYANYGSYMSIGYNPAKATPASFADLTKPGATVALAGDPRQDAAGFYGLMAASLRSGVPQPSQAVELFSQLKGRMADPRTADVVIDWDHVNAARAAKTPESWKVTIPRDAALGTFYVQAIAKNAPHPASARLWQEYLFSDEGQNLLQKGYARPVRAEAMLMRGTLDTEQAAKLPVAPGPPVLLTIPQTDAAKSYVRARWSTVAG